MVQDDYNDDNNYYNDDNEGDDYGDDVDVDDDDVFKSEVSLGNIASSDK